LPIKEGLFYWQGECIVTSFIANVNMLLLVLLAMLICCCLFYWQGECIVTYFIGNIANKTSSNILTLPIKQAATY
jgi:hypothetical protein